LHELLSDRFTERWREPRAATAAYERHNAGVRSTTYPHRLVEWRTGDGWDRVCRALNLPLPDQLFPHVNTRADCQERIAKLKARIDALIAEEASLAHRASEGVSEAPSAPTSRSGPEISGRSFAPVPRSSGKPCSACS